jgi:hypothetical protein
MATMPDDGVRGLCGVEVLLPAQQGKGPRLQARYSSTHRLMLGILQDAVETYRKACDPTRRISPRTRREVCGWFASHDQSWPFSFERICEALDLDADYLRRGLLGAARRRDGAMMALR